jgi:hypothetical protein
MEQNEENQQRQVGLFFAAALTGSLTRREVLKRAAALGISATVLPALLAACSNGASPTVPVAGATAPANATTGVAAPTVGANATATGGKGGTPTGAAPGADLGAQYIGKLEGPTIITDPAQIPKSFKEAPQLAELTKAGKLPAVADRIGSEPLVIKPLNEIGKYGGSWRRAFTGPGDGENGNRINSSDKLLFWDYTGNTIVASLAKGWELSADGKSLKVFLRKGVRWSDGEPFTAND